MEVRTDFPSSMYHTKLQWAQLGKALNADAGQPIIVWVVLPGNESEPTEESWGMYNGDFLCTPDYTDGYDITNFSTEWIAYRKPPLQN